MIRRVLLLCLACMTGNVPVLPGLAAQGPWSGPRRVAVRLVPELGVRASYDWDGPGFGVGGQFRFPMGAVAELVPSGDYSMTGDSTSWQVNLDLVSRTGRQQMIYVGGGGAVVRRSFRAYGIRVTEPRRRLGINLFAGVAVPRFLALPIVPYVEARWTFVREYDASIWVVAGLNVPLGRRSPRR